MGAGHLAREFHPVFDETDLINLPNYRIYLKLMVNGAASRAFSAITLSPPERKTSYKDAVIKRSRIEYGRPRKEVEREILLRSHLER